MNNRRALLAVILSILTLSCSWSSDQQEVLDSWGITMDNMEEGHWDSLMDRISPSTVLFLDSMSVELEDRGLQWYADSRELLKVLCDEYVDFPGEPTMVLIEGDRAEISLSSGITLRLQRDGDLWKLELDSIFRSSLDNALEGSYVH